MRISDWSSDVCSSDLSARSRGLMQQLAALVVAHGFDVHIGSRCQAADRERVWTHSLTPYPGTEISMPGCKQLPLNLLFRPSLARASPPLARPSVASCHWYW